MGSQAVLSNSQMAPDPSGSTDSGQEAPGPTPETSNRLNGLANCCKPLDSFEHNADDSEKSSWAGKTILTLDGGGIRGYSSLLIIERLMDKIRELEEKWSNGEVCASGDYPWMSNTRSSSSNQFLPCHYFDYIAGTSTGGLSAIMLGRLRMSVQEALNHYKNFGNSVFGKSRRWHERSYLYFPRAKYSSRRVRKAINAVIYSTMKGKDPTIQPFKAQSEPFESSKEQTRTMVFSFCKKLDDGVEVIHLWRTYDNVEDASEQNNAFRKLNGSKAHREPIWQVARATSAAPTFFECIKIGDRKHFDGGMGANNPSVRALQEIGHMHEQPAALSVSIGTGIKKAPRSKATEAREIFSSHSTDDVSRKQFIRKYYELGWLLKDFTTDCEATTNDWRHLCEKSEIPFRRFNVEHRLGQIPLDDWRPKSSGQETLEDIRKLTEEYLDSDQVRDDIQFCAEMLVEIRQQRSRTERWERFATDIEYACPIATCHGKPSCRSKHRKKIREHLIHRHNQHGENLEERLNQGRFRPNREVHVNNVP